MLPAMLSRPIASGNVSFGLVSIPVKLYSTVENSNAIRFNWLDAKHGVRLEQQYISPLAAYEGRDPNDSQESCCQVTDDRC